MLAAEDLSEDLCCGDCPRWRGIVGEGTRGVCLEPEDTDLVWIRMMDEPACEDAVEGIRDAVAAAEALRRLDEAELAADAMRDEQAQREADGGKEQG